jgi:hypothetical protein
MPFLLGVLMGVAGFAMVVLGEVKLPGGRVIKGRPARRASVVWLSFLPLAILSGLVLEFLDSESIVDRRLVYWILVMLCFFVGLGFVLPAWSAGGRPRQRRPAQAKSCTANPFETQPAAPASTESSPQPPSAPEPWLAPESKSGRRRAPEEKNPFDFS